MSVGSLAMPRAVALSGNSNPPTGAQHFDQVGLATAKKAAHPHRRLLGFVQVLQIAAQTWQTYWPSQTKVSKLVAQGLQLAV